MWQIFSFAKNKGPYSAAYTVQQIIDIIIKDIPGAPFAKTVDTIKYGSPDALVTGIVTTMVPTVALIEKAVALNANLIIAHEPTYYNGQDVIDWVPNNKIIKQNQFFNKTYLINNIHTNLYFKTTQNYSKYHYNRHMI